MKEKKFNKIGVIVQARMGSTRLPGKVLFDIGNNKKILDLVIQRLKLSKLTDELIIATTPDEKNSLIIDLVKTYENVQVFIGSEENVLERYYEAAKKFHLGLVIRVTSDCPFIDSEVLDDMIRFYIENDYDYIRNNYNTNFPRGLDIEVLSFKVLEEVFLKAESKTEKEHVTYYIYTHPDLFKIGSYNINSLKKFENLRLTVDEKDDLEMCREVYKKLLSIGKEINFSIFDIIRIIEKEPQLMNINKHVVQKKV